MWLKVVESLFLGYGRVTLLAARQRLKEDNASLYSYKGLDYRRNLSI
jgi:hypothetical protein